MNSNDKKIRTKVTLKDIEQAIVSKTFTMLPSGKKMVCELIMYNGFSVSGESAIVDPANHVQALGEKYAYEAAIDNCWPLMGFLLQEQIYRSKQFAGIINAAQISLADIHEEIKAASQPGNVRIVKIDLSKASIPVPEGDEVQTNVDGKLDAHDAMEAVRNVFPFVDPSHMGEFLREMTITGVLAYRLAGGADNAIAFMKEGIEIMGDEEECKRLATALCITTIELPPLDADQAAGKSTTH